MSEDGRTLAVGSRVSDDRGRVRVYGLVSDDTNVDEWRQLGEDIEGEVGSESFRISLSSDGTLLAVGGPSSAAGAVRVFEWLDEEWGELSRTLVSSESDSLSFGRALALDGRGHRLVVGAPLSSYSRGRAELFDLAVNTRGGGFQAPRIKTGVLEEQVPGAGVKVPSTLTVSDDKFYFRQLGLDIDGEAAGDSSGRSVSLSSDGSRVAIGANYNDGNGGNSCLLYTSPSPRDKRQSRMPSSA